MKLWTGKKSVVILIAVFAVACDAQTFEALKSDNSQSDTVDTAPETEIETDTETEFIDVEKHQPLPGHSMFDEDAPNLAPYQSLPEYTVGDGTPLSCDEDELFDKVKAINAAKEGQLRFNCGDRFHRIKLYSSITIDADVRILISGGFDAERREPLLALDGRHSEQLLVMMGNNDVVLEHLILVNGKNDVDRPGGAITCHGEADGGKLTISESVFKNNNSTTLDGGAIYASRLSQLVIYRSVFEGNHGDSGGALFMRECQFGIVDSLFIANKAGKEGGAIFMHNKETEADTAYTYNGVTFTRNNSDGDGSGIAIQQAAHVVTRLEQCEFYKNTANWRNVNGDVGGTLNVLGGSLMLQSSSFIGNKSFNAVAGVYVKSENQFTAENCTFADNATVSGKSGAIHEEDDATSTIRNCTFLRNRGTEAGAIYREEPQNLYIVSSLFVDDSKNQVSGSCNQTFGDTADNGGTNMQYEADPSIDFIPCTQGIHRTDPEIGNPIIRNGGMVSTCAIGESSPARNIGADCARVDARNVSREIEDSSSSCDAGAFEFTDTDAALTTP